MKERISTLQPHVRVIEPSLDAEYALTPREPREISIAQAPPRLNPLQVGRRDWHNDFQSLILDLQEKLDRAADEKARGAILRKVRRALSGSEE
jgi:metallo-beta-lactamase family protein